MIKPINISPLNTSTELYFKCSSCGLSGNIKLTNRVIHTDNQGNTSEELDYECQKCGKLLNRSN